jgi:hypothetical protein
MHCLAQIPDRTTLLIDAQRADYIDRDIRETLDKFVGDAVGRQITVERLRWPVEVRQTGNTLQRSLMTSG